MLESDKVISLNYFQGLCIIIRSSFAFPAHFTFPPLLDEACSCHTKKSSFTEVNKFLLAGRNSTFISVVHAETSNKTWKAGGNEKNKWKKELPDTVSLKAVRTTLPPLVMDANDNTLTMDVVSSLFHHLNNIGYISSSCSTCCIASVVEKWSDG